MMKRAFRFGSTAAALLVFIGTVAGGAQVQISLQTGVQLGWPTAINNNYQLQWSPNPGSTWNNLGGLVLGNGSTNTLYDPVPGGTRLYQALEFVPGVAASSAIPTNGGFEIGSGNSATGWTVDTAVGGPVYAVRTNDNPHSGSSDFQVYVASTGAGPVVQFNQAGVPVTGGTTYPFTFYANALPGSAGCNAQWRILWNTGGDTGYQTYTPGNNVYAIDQQFGFRSRRSDVGDHLFPLCRRGGSKPVGHD